MRHIISSLIAAVVLLILVGTDMLPFLYAYNAGVASVVFFQWLDRREADNLPTKSTSVGTLRTRINLMEKAKRHATHCL